MLDVIRSIRGHRDARRLSQQAVANLAALSQPRYSAIELGKIDPRTSTLVDIARALDLELMLVPKEMVPVIESVLVGEPDAEDQPMFSAEGD